MLVTKKVQQSTLLNKKGIVKPVLNGRSQKDRKLFFKTNYRLMQVKSIKECSMGSILQYFGPSLSYHLSLRSLSCLFLSGRFTQVLLYKPKRWPIIFSRQYFLFLLQCSCESSAGRLYIIIMLFSDFVLAKLQIWVTVLARGWEPRANTVESGPVTGTIGNHWINDIFINQLLRYIAFLHLIWPQLNTDDLRLILLTSSQYWLTLDQYSVQWATDKRSKIVFQDWLSLNAGQKYCRMLQESILQYFWPSLSYHL